MTDLPEGLALVRTTPVFTNETVPAGLLRAHQVAEGVWGRLVVRRGSVGFVFEDTPGEPLFIAAGESVVIPPSRPHHVKLLDEPAEFVVEFYRPPSHADEHGGESTGLDR